MLKAILNKLPDVFLSILVSFSLTYALASSSLCMHYSLAEILLIITLCTAILYLLFYNKKMTIISTIVLCSSFAATVVYVLFKCIDEIVEFISEYSFWFYDFIMYPNDSEPFYQQITVIFMCILVSVLSYIFVIKKFRFFVILIAGMSLFGFQASYKIVTVNAPFYLFLLATLMSYLKYVFSLKASKEKNEYAKSGAIVMWSIPVSILIICLSMLIHASDRPITWNWLDQKFVSVYNYFQKKFDYEAFDYFSLSATSGFGDSKDYLGGRVRLDRKNVLRVITNKRIYLSGVSRDVYTGNMWKNSSEVLEPLDVHLTGIYDDTQEMVTGMKILTGEDNFFSEYFDSNQINVTFLNLKTKSLFKPAKIKELDSIAYEISASMSDTGDISSGTRLKKDYQYSIKSYVPKMGTEFDNIMRKSKKGLYEEYIMKLNFPSYYEPEPFIYNYTNINPPEEAPDKDDASNSGDDEAEDKSTIIFKATYGSSDDIDIATYGSDSNTSDQGDASDSSENDAVYQSTVIISNNKELKRVQMIEELKALNESSKLIYDKYLQLPETLPQRVKDLAASLTDSAGNNYDKAKAIEKYLAANYTYNLDVPHVPRDRDFVDFFLFDQTEGYCTYFASAMTILARCAGLPARYVEGYMLPPDPVKDRNNMYIVTNMQAHAWVEVYFEGYGWLPFEPTSPFRSAFYETQVTEQASYSSDYNPAYEDYMKMMMQYYGQVNGGGMIDMGTGAQSRGPSVSDIILISIASLTLLLLLLMLFNILRSRIKLFNTLNLPVRDCILRSYDYYLKVLKLEGLGLMPSETPHQYSERIDSMLFFSPVKFKVITDIFVKSRYSQNEVSEKEKMLYSDFYQGFLNEIKINMGKFKYFALRYILGRI